MMKNNWFSARLRYAVVTEEGGLLHYMDSIRLFKAIGYAEAFSKALDLGRKDEEEYMNVNGERVAWRLASVESLDNLGTSIVDGQEIHSAPVDANPASNISFETKFEPEGSVPSQTL